MATASRRCMVFKCGKTSKDRNLSFHSFPKREDIRDQWIVNIKLGQPDWTIPKCSSSKYYAICSTHFEKHCFRTVKHKFDLASRNTLKPDAIPTLCMNGQPGLCLQSGTSSKCSPSLKKKSEGYHNTKKEKIEEDNDSQSGNEDMQFGEYSKESNTCSLDLYKSGNSPSYDHLQMSKIESPNVDDRIIKKYPLASRRCMVVGCGSTSKDRSLSFHAFPKNPDVRELWLEKIKISRPNWTNSNWPESNYYAICSRHFETNCFKTMKHDFSGTSRNTLRPDAVPSLYLTEQPVVVSSKYRYSSVPTNYVMGISGAEEMNGLNGSGTSRDIAHNFPVSGSSHNEEYNQSCNTWVTTPLAITDVHTENGKWSPVEPFHVEAATQTDLELPTSPTPKKQTRTVRIQTLITVKKSIQHKGIQADQEKAVSAHDQSTQYETPLSELVATAQVLNSNTSQDTTPPSQRNSSIKEDLASSITQNGTASDHKEKVELRSSLLSMFKSCPLCSTTSTTKILKDLGEFFSILQSCQNAQCSFEQLWTNQPLNGLNNSK